MLLYLRMRMPSGCEAQRARAERADRVRFVVCASWWLCFFGSRAAVPLEI